MYSTHAMRTQALDTLDQAGTKTHWATPPTQLHQVVGHGDPVLAREVRNVLHEGNALVLIHLSDEPKVENHDLAVGRAHEVACAAGGE